MRNYQFTLTFRKDVSVREARIALNKWLIPLRKMATTDPAISFQIVGEISPNLKYHFHGYIEYSEHAPSAETNIKRMLFRWKTMHGFVKLSHGTLHRWVEYMKKEPHPLIDEKFFHLVVDNVDNAESASPPTDILPPAPPQEGGDIDPKNLN